MEDKALDERFVALITQKIEEWRQRICKAMVTIERQGINPFEVLRNLKFLSVETIPRLQKTGFLSVDHVKRQFSIEIRRGLTTNEATRTEYHELAHFICVAHGRGPRHHGPWREIVSALGFPEEAEIDWPDVV